MRHNLPSCRQDLVVFATALGWSENDPGAFPDKLASLANTIGLRKVLAASIVPDAALAEMARQAVANRRLMDPNPRPITEADAIEIYRRTLQAHG
jgi:alcohol dehydrogenase class IV